ncbi:MAG: hypothetical protein KGO83_04580, partial [Paenibacillaceae bacterium]|nr:hypothetical protein [Paenibacillaceae bacterium]
MNGLGTPVQLIWSVVAGVVAFFLNDRKETGENQFMRYFDYVYNREIAANGSRLEVGDGNLLKNEIGRLGTFASVLAQKQCSRQNQCEIIKTKEFNTFVRKLNPSTQRVVWSWLHIDGRNYTQLQQHVYNAMAKKITLPQLKQLLMSDPNRRTQSVITEVVSECARIRTLFSNVPQNFCSEHNLFKGTKEIGASSGVRSGLSSSGGRVPKRKSNPNQNSVANMCNGIMTELDRLVKSIDFVLQQEDAYFSSNNKPIPPKNIRALKDELQKIKSNLIDVQTSFEQVRNERIVCTVYSPQLAGIRGEIGKTLRLLNTNWKVLEKV